MKTTAHVTFAAPASSFVHAHGAILRRNCSRSGEGVAHGESAGCRKKRAAALPRSALDPAAPAFAPPIVHDVLRTSGQQLNADARASMESRFNHDFSQVRVHTSAQAAASARSVNARAYTVGSHVVFGANEFAPETLPGRRLIAHELAHVAQQCGANAAPILAQNDRAEHEANTAAKAVTEGVHGAVPSLTPSAGGLMAQGNPGQTFPRSGVWTTDYLTIILDSNRQNCFGAADVSGVDRYSNCGSPERGQFCQSLSVPYEVRFFIDRATQPRPKPFTPPTVRAAFDFVTTTGKQGFKSDQTDSNPKYTKPNDPLTPSFGSNFPIGSSESGMLKVLLELKDPDSGVNLKYDDKIKFEVVPCM
jgi:hypothetical protein